VYHSLDITIPHIKYATAPLHNQKGLLRLPLGFTAWRSGATEIATATLINTVAAAY
jgi:hypothetical protein